MKKLVPVSFLLGLASTVTILASSDQNMKDWGYIGFGASVPILAFGVLEDNKESRGKHDESNQVINMQSTVEKLDKERVKALDGKKIIAKEYEDFKQQCESKLEILRDEALRQVEIKNTLNEKILELKNELKLAKKDSDSALKNISNFSTSSGYEIVSNTCELQFKKLDGIISAYKRNYSALSEFFDNLEADIDQIKSRSIAELESYEGQKTLQVLIDDGLRIQERIISRCYDIKLKSLTTIISYLKELSQDSLPSAEYNEVIRLLLEKANEEISVREIEKESVVEQWVHSNNQTEQKYETKFSDNLKHWQQSAIENDRLKNEIEAMNRPLKWSVATRQDLRIGNIIIDYYERLGIILDRASVDFDYWQSTLSFHIDRNRRIITPNELEPEGERLKQLCHTLSDVKFGWNSDEGLLTVWLHLSKKPAKQIIESDINKIWKTADKFQSIVKGWSRVRLTGGSESGKSPTAENLAVCILLARGGTAEVYNPREGSIKDYWTIPTVGSTHEDSVLGIESLATIVNQKGGDRSQFKITIFDEVDSSLQEAEKEKKQKIVGGQILTIIKQISHQNLGCIFIGQNANVSNYPGTDRSDWNSVFNVHIGSNAYEAITNTNQITNEEQTRLKLQVDKLTEFCDSKNQELGLEKANPQAYRFAIVLGDGKPYFIQLPNFGQFTYDLIESVVKCPECDSLNVKKNGGKRRKCKDCGNDFTV